MTNHRITSENLLRTLPEVLSKDDKMRALATVVADVLASRPEEINALRIYPQIDKVPEALLDILANDLKIDWYGYNYPLPIKRSQFKSSFKVRQHLGTKGAIEKALRDLYPDTVLEEWFEYGGDPYYFRVMLDVTHQIMPVVYPDIVRTIEMFKNQRSLLEDNSIVIRCRNQVAVGVTTGYIIYGVRLCGTFPVRATQGVITNDDVVIVTDSVGASYAAPRSGTVLAGTHPVRATQGVIDPDNIVIVSEDVNVVYAVPRSGEINAGLYPATAVQGGIEDSGVGIGTDGGGVAYSARFCGTAPDSLI